MIQLYDGGAYVLNGTEIIADTVESASILAGKLGSVPEKEEAKKQKKLNFLYKDLEEKIKRNLGTKVTINAKDEKKGKIEIEYFSKEELERITDILSNN